MTTSNQTGTSGGESTPVDRRTVLKVAGGTALAVTAFSGTASAHQSKFFGCERVCGGTDGDYAVVSVDDGYECRELENRGPRDDVPWDWDAHCYVASEGEAIVGFIEEDEYKDDEGCWLCLNPNACAADHYESRREVRDAIDESTCTPCEGELNISVDCKTAAEPADGGEGAGSADGEDSESTDDGGESTETTDGAEDAGSEDAGEAGSESNDESAARQEFGGVVRQVDRLLRRFVSEFHR